MIAAPFLPPQPWTLDWGNGPRLAFAGDVDGDGRADLVQVYTPGSSIVDVRPNVEGVKTGDSVQAVPRWAGPCAAATVGEFDAARGADVVGLFGRGLKLAGTYQDGRFTNLADVVTLPRALEKPALATLGRTILAFSTVTGDAFRIDPIRRTVSGCSVPKGTAWIGAWGGLAASQNAAGTVFQLDATRLKVLGKLGKGRAGVRPAMGPGWVAFGETVWSGERGVLSGEFKDPLRTPHSPLPTIPDRLAADFDGDGDADLMEIRPPSGPYGENEVYLRRFFTKGETDPDRDGLTTAEERRRKTDPLDPDTDADGLLDGWEVRGYRGLDLPKLGCDPRHADLVCLVSRFDDVDEKRFREGMDGVAAFYAALDAPNPDGKKGMRFVRIDLETVKGANKARSWQANRDALRPLRWRGMVHWMQVTRGGGGQSDELSDGGGCGEGALRAVFVHEFGHQLGLNHDGFWRSGWSPTYGSLMNYVYSYTFDGSPDGVRYSPGDLKGLVLRESDLDETLPLPYDKVRFLERAPYRFRLKADGANTLIDWNWNGVFGERHVRADINYAYSTEGGPRDTAGRADAAPWLFVHDGAAYLLSGLSDVPTKDDPTLSPSRPGKLVLRRLRKPTEWDEPWTVAEGLVGDPVAASVGGRIVVAMPKANGVSLLTLDPTARRVEHEEPVRDSKGLVPTIGEGTLMLWNPEGGAITVWPLTGGEAVRLDATSTNPPGLATDPKTGDTVLALAQNQDAGRPNRWQIRRYGPDWKEKGMEWVEGPEGGARGVGRLTLLADADHLYLFGRGMTAPSCTYVAMTLADKSIRGGWLVKRYYDEWTQSRSAPAVAWYGGDLIWAYRWFGEGGANHDGDLHVAYRALGIQPEPFGDHDDVSFVRNYGARHSLLNLGRP